VAERLTGVNQDQILPGNALLRSLNRDATSGHLRKRFHTSSAVEFRRPPRIAKTQTTLPGGITMRWDVTAGHVPVADGRRDGPSKSDIADDAADDMQAAGPPSGRVSVGGQWHILTTDALQRLQRGDHRLRCVPPGGDAGAAGLRWRIDTC
jgi:hypothetical protein